MGRGEIDPCFIFNNNKKECDLDTQLVPRASAYPSKLLPPPASASLFPELRTVSVSSLGLIEQLLSQDKALGLVTIPAGQTSLLGQPLPGPRAAAGGLRAAGTPNEESGAVTGRGVFTS